MSVGQFIYILSARLHLSPGKALFVFVNNTLPQTGKPFLLASKTCLFFSFINLSLSLSAAALMDSIYETYKDEDGFVYVCYSSEKTFG